MPTRKRSFDDVKICCQIWTKFSFSLFSFGNLLILVEEKRTWSEKAFRKVQSNINWTSRAKSKEEKEKCIFLHSAQCSLFSGQFKRCWREEAKKAFSSSAAKANWIKTKLGIFYPLYLFGSVVRFFLLSTFPSPSTQRAAAPFKFSLRSKLRLGKGLTSDETARVKKNVPAEWSGKLESRRRAATMTTSATSKKGMPECA